MELDMKTLIHVGTELIVLTGLAFWMNKRIALTESKMKLMEDQLVAYGEALNKQGKLLAQHDQIFSQMLGGIGGRPLSPPVGGDVPEKEQGIKEKEQGIKEKTPDRKIPVEKKPKKKKKDLTPEEIDRIIQLEMEKEKMAANGEIVIETRDLEKSKSLKHKKKEK
jgi:hypothetical protein